MLLQVSGKKLYLLIWCQNMAGKKVPKYRLGEERHPWKDHTYPNKEVIVYLLVRGVVQWGCGESVCKGDHCKWRAGMSCNTPSQMCGSWYLSRFLFKGGSLTWMYMASLMVLVMPWDSLSTSDKLSSLMECPVVWEWWKMVGGSHDRFLVPVPKISACFPYVFHCASLVVTPVPIDDTSFVDNAVPVLRSHQ